MKSPIFQPAAAADVEDAYRWYEDQRAGLGEEFLAAVNTVVESLVAYPERFPVVYRQTTPCKFASFYVQPFLPNYRRSGHSGGLHAWTTAPTAVAISQLMANFRVEKDAADPASHP